jgi:hypothetical protein
MVILMAGGLLSVAQGQEEWTASAAAEREERKAAAEREEKKLRYDRMQETREHRKYIALQRISDLVTRYANGMVTRNTIGAFIRQVMKTASSPQIKDLLARRVDPLSRDAFQPIRDSGFADLCERETGDLRVKSITTVLRHARHADVGTATMEIAWSAYEDLKRVWPCAIRQLNSPDGVKDETIDDLHEALWKLEQVFDALQSCAVGARDKRADRELGRLKLCANQLHNPRFSQRLRDYIYGADFEGGTCGDLVRFLIEHNVGPKSGSRASECLAQLAYAVVGQEARRQGYADSRSQPDANPSGTADGYPNAPDDPAELFATIK